MKCFQQKIIFLIVFVCSANKLAAQDSSTQKQIWPELEVYYRINEKFRLYGLVSGTRSNSEYTDGTASVYIDYFALPWLRGRNDTELGDSSRGYFLWFRAGYSYSDAPPSDKKKVVNIIETETNNNFHLPGDLVMIDRNRFDWRWVNGLFQPIYRPRIKFAKNLKTQYLTLDAYVWTEYFFYLNDNTQNRLRLTLGTEIKVFKNMDFEVYFLHQFQNKQYVAPLNAIGIQLDFYFRSKRYKPPQ
jgi:uncharacterized protein DUF2490